MKYNNNQTVERPAVASSLYIYNCQS